MSTQPTTKDMMESIPVTPHTVAMYRRFVEHPEEMKELVKELKGE